jgi:hypothetical protein
MQNIPHADSPGGPLPDVGHSSALHEQGTMKYLLELVKNNPGPTLLSAAVLGFLAARILSHD